MHYIFIHGKKFINLILYLKVFIISKVYVLFFIFYSYNRIEYFFFNIYHMLFKIFNRFIDLYIFHTNLWIYKSLNY